MCSKSNGGFWVFFIGISLVISLFPKNSLSLEAFPTKPITMIGRSAPGSMTDSLTRIISKAAEKELGQPIIVDNKSGGGGVVAMNYVVRSKPDGYTIGNTATGTYTNNPHMEEVAYNPFTDITDIMVFFKFTHALCVKADAPWNTFDDVIAYSKKNPGKFTYGAAGVGTTQHILMERISRKEGIKFSFVPFKSGAEPVLAVLGGHISAVAEGPADIVPHVQTGKLKLLFALNDERWAVAPNVPCALEKYGFYALSLQSIYGPKGIPEYVREKIHDAYKKAQSDPTFIEATKQMNVVVTYMSGKDYDKLWRSQYDEMGNIIRAMGLGKK